jgi:glycosyltransferase involved in cell wall biosynthesis
MIQMLASLQGGRRFREGKRAISPLVSIIVVLFHAGSDLPALLHSVLQLKNESTELIIVDGGSDDGTRELLQKHDSVIDYWVSEPDGGIYDAMNKGIAAAEGTFVLHLNAGDRLLHVPLRQLQESASAGIDVVAFRVSVDGKKEFQPSYGLGLRINNTLHHQGTFFRRENFPLYDVQYRVFADFDVNQRLALSGATLKIFDEVVAFHSSGGISDVPNNAVISEFFHVIAKNYGRAYVPFAWLLCKWSGFLRRSA